MNNTPKTGGLVFARLPTTQLSKIVFSEEPMPMELAVAIRIFRRDQKLSYPEIMWALAESNPDAGQCYTFGQALTEQAFRLLKDPDSSWK